MVGGIITIMILATIFFGIAAIIGVSFWGMNMSKGVCGSKTKEQQAKETEIIQQIYQGLNKMEERIEALETILLGSKEKDESNDKL